MQFPVTATPAALLALAGRLAEPAPLTEAARRLLAPWLEQIRPAVYDFAVSEMSEEYIVFQLWERREQLARGSRRLDRRAGAARVGAAQPGRGSRGHPA